MSTQVTAEELARMSVEQIRAAYEAGRLDELLGRSEPEVDQLEATLTSLVGPPRQGPNAVGLNSDAIVRMAGG